MMCDYNTELPILPKQAKSLEIDIITAKEQTALPGSRLFCSSFSKAIDEGACFIRELKEEDGPSSFDGFPSFDIYISCT